MNFSIQKQMNTSITSFAKRRSQALQVFASNIIACFFALICYMINEIKIDEDKKVEYKVKTFELISCELLSCSIAILEIYGESTNSHVHIIISFYTLLEVFFNRQEQAFRHNAITAFLFIIKSTIIQRSKILECQLSSSEALPALLWQTKKFNASKKTYCRFIYFLCFKDFFIGRYFKVRREYVMEALLLLVNQAVGVFDEIRPDIKFCIEATTVILIAILKCIIIADTIPEMGFSSILTFVVSIIYLFFICLHYKLNSLNFKNAILKKRKSLLGS